MAFDAGDGDDLVGVLVAGRVPAGRKRRSAGQPAAGSTSEVTFGRRRGEKVKDAFGRRLFFAIFSRG